MFEVKTENFGSSFESVYPKPLPFNKSGIIEVAEKISETLQGWGIKPTTLKLKRTDLLFGYELRVNLYGGNAFLSADAERVLISFSNGRSHADALAIFNASSALYRSFAFPPNTTTTSIAYAHSIFESVQKRNEYLSMIKLNGIEGVSGLIAYHRVKKWDSEIRFQVDRSNTYPAGLFLHWTTAFTNKEVNTELLTTLSSAITEIPEMYQLKLSQIP